jgi:uncharacterized repeat protein (TIGR01451 family)
MRSKIIACGLIFLCLLSLTAGITSAVSNFDGNNWNYYREIPVKENSGMPLNNYQILITLKSANFDFTKARSDGSDIRFTDATGNEMSYWIEEWNVESRNAKVWVNVPFIPANGESTITMYYGNENANSVSDGVATFVWFDEYESQNLGVTPAGWNLTNPAIGNCTITSEEKKSGTKSIKLVDASTGGSPRACINFPAQTEKFILEVDYLIKDGNPIISSYISDRSQYQYGAVYFQNGDIRYYDGQNIYQTIQTYNLNQWYSIRHYLDISKSRVDIWVDGIIGISNGRLVWSCNYVDRFCLGDSNSLGTGLGTGTAYVDNPRIRKYASAEPTISISAELPTRKASALVLTKSATPSTIQKGETTTIAIKVENTGLEDVKAVKVTDNITAGFEIIEGSNSASFDEIKPGDYRIFEYTLNATEFGKFTSDPATATYKDADGNSYSAASNPVSIQVGGEVPGGADSDGDGWSDKKEREMGTNPYSVDSDADGLKDSEDPNPTVPEQRTFIPGFEAIFALIGVLSVAYLVLKR